MEDNQLVTAKVASEALAITTDLPENKLITYGELLEMIPSHDFGVELVEEFAEMIDFWNDGNANILFLIGTQSTKSIIMRKPKHVMLRVECSLEARAQVIIGSLSSLKLNKMEKA